MTLMLSGCADGRSGQPASQEERNAARQLVAQLLTIAQQPDVGRLLVVTDPAPLLGLLAPSNARLGAASVSWRAHHRGDVGPRHVARSSSEECLIATANSVTASQCHIAEHVVDGTWSSDGNRVHAELVDVFVLGTDAHGSVALEATLGVGEGLSGTLDADIMWSTDARDHVLDARVQANDLLVEGADCASGGQLTLAASLDGGPATSVSLWFGPGCTDVHITR